MPEKYVDSSSAKMQPNQDSPELGLSALDVNDHKNFAFNPNLMDRQWLIQKITLHSNSENNDTNLM